MQMRAGSAEEPRRILVLKTELLYAEALAGVARATFPHAEIVFSNRVQDATKTLHAGPLDLLVTGLGLIDRDMLDFLFVAMSGCRMIRTVLVATSRRERRAFEGLASLPIGGVFDTDGESMSEFANALRAVVAGSGYWSRSLDRGPVRWLSSHPGNDADHLTPVEQLVLAMIGDGTDDAAAAEQLGIKRSSVHSVRRELHRKLGVQHRGELMRHAVQKGFVRITSEGVQRPGYAMLLAECARRRDKRIQSTIAPVNARTRTEPSVVAA